MIYAHTLARVSQLQLYLPPLLHKGAALHCSHAFAIFLCKSHTLDDYIRWQFMGERTEVRDGKSCVTNSYRFYNKKEHVIVRKKATIMQESD